MRKTMVVMERDVFEINDRFEISRKTNTILDKKSCEKHRMEPRLMRLLFLLAEQPGQVVARETIIRNIWNDYPGAGEGLNQAISFLRKVLHDDTKTLIRTLPKTGYVFDGRLRSVGAEAGSSQIHPVVRSSFAWRYLLAFLPVAAIVVLAWNYLVTPYESRQQDEARRISRMDEARAGFRLDQGAAEDSLRIVTEQVKRLENDILNSGMRSVFRDSLAYLRKYEANLQLRIQEAKRSLDSLRRVGL